MNPNTTPTTTIRVRTTTHAALQRAAYNPPFSCASIAEFLRLVERGDLAAISAWQKAAKEHHATTQR
jgi:hypothetical protein